MKPSTRLGRASLWALLVFLVSVGLLSGLIATGERGGATFFANPWLALSGIAAVVSAVAGAILGVVAIASRRERSAGVVLAVVVGLLVAAWVSLEVAFPHSVAP